MTPCPGAGEPWPVKAFSLLPPTRSSKFCPARQKSFFYGSLDVGSWKACCFLCSCVFSIHVLGPFIYLPLSGSWKLPNLKSNEVCSCDKPACDHCLTQGPFRLTFISSFMLCYCLLQFIYAPSVRSLLPLCKTLHKNPNLYCVSLAL